MKLAIIGGISDYQFQRKLVACRNDATIMRTFLQETKLYSDICFLDPDTTAAAAKKAITEFVQRHRDDDVTELVFYFSGHGDRYDNDFFYAFADYKVDKRERSGLRNSELDSLIRNLNPELTIKIVDACYSGSTYIKSEEDIRPVLQKSANENQLKKLYFFHSSAADQTSTALPHISWFTQAIFKSLVDHTGSVRYRDLMAAVADEMELTGGPRPTFVVQADSLEIFVYMNETLKDLITNALRKLTADQENAKDPGTLSDGGPRETYQSVTSASNSLASLASAKAKDVYCTASEATNNVSLLKQLTDPESWPTKIKDVYELVVQVQEPSEIPNGIAIARWISTIKNDNVFALPLYETETYKVDEYKEMPRKPSTLGIMGRYALPTVSALSHHLNDNKEYKLETVEKKRSVISGFEYTVDPVFSPHVLYFRPKFASLDEYAACVVCLFSRRLLTCLYSVEHLPYRAWNVATPPRAGEWKQHSAPLKNIEKLKELVKTVMEEIVDYIEMDARQRLA